MYIYVKLMDNLSIDIINKINEYKPKDKDVKSPIKKCFNHLIEFYEDYEFNKNVCIPDSTEIIYLVLENEPFYKYALRINNREYKSLKYNNIHFSNAHLYFKILEDDDDDAEDNTNPSIDIPPFIFDDD